MSLPFPLQELQEQTMTSALSICSSPNFMPDSVSAAVDRVGVAVGVGCALYVLSCGAPSFLLLL